ncbi:hypothetical protein [Rubripirellula lacrimiformis]|uniref:hypothetical protein n=1 Tax=Rubripirellula lacrimiformis TaxID=1930273 RepID=UPI001C54F41F|nr:hypothetical protein [Rubripirellula lacrimiformis]
MTKQVPVSGFVLFDSILMSFAIFIEKLVSQIRLMSVNPAPLFQRLQWVQPIETRFAVRHFLDDALP